MSMIERKTRANLQFSISTAMAEDAAGMGLRPGPEVIRRLQGMPGRRLPGGLAKVARSTFGAGVRDVRLHVGPRSEEALALVGAEACCLGRHIFLPGWTLARPAAAAAMLLHELAHIARGPRHDVLRCWNASDHASQSQAACATFRPLLTAVASAVGLSWSDFVSGVRNASSNMDFRGRAARPLSTASYLLGSLTGLGAKGEGVSHGEGRNYTSTSFTLNARLNLAEQTRHANMAVVEIFRDTPLLTIGRTSIRTPAARSGSLGSTVGGVTLMEREWVKSLANAFHVAQDRGSHREGVQAHGHDDPRCAGGWNPDHKAHEHTRGKAWQRCSEAAYNRGLNNSLDVVRHFLLGIRRRSGGSFVVPTPARMAERCP